MLPSQSRSSIGTNSNDDTAFLIEELKRHHFPALATTIKTGIALSKKYPAGSSDEYFSQGYIDTDVSLEGIQSKQVLDQQLIALCENHYKAIISEFKSQTKSRRQDDEQRYLNELLYFFACKTEKLLLLHNELLELAIKIYNLSRPAVTPYFNRNGSFLATSFKGIVESYLKTTNTHSSAPAANHQASSPPPSTQTMIEEQEQEEKEEEEEKENTFLSTPASPAAKKLFVSNQYEEMLDGKAVIYKKLFAETRAMLSGERKLFANTRAYYKGGHNVTLFANTKEMLKGNRPLLANTRYFLGNLTDKDLQLIDEKVNTNNTYKPKR